MRPNRNGKQGQEEKKKARVKKMQQQSKGSLTFPIRSIPSGMAVYIAF